MRHWLFSLALIASSPWILSAQEPPRQVQAGAGVTVRGKVIRTDGPDRLVIRTDANKEVTLFATPETRYTIQGKAGRFTDLRVGTELSAVYVTRDDRFLVNTVTVGAAAEPVPPAVGTPANELTLRGKIVKVQGQDQVIIRTTAGKEVTLYVGPASRFMINGKAGRMADLRVGAEVSVTYANRNERYWIETITIGEATAVETQPPAEGTTVTGSVVRVVGQDQVVVRTSDNKEVIVYVNPQTRYTFDERPARFVDIQSGADVRIVYDVRDRRNVARSILGVRRNKK